MAVDLLIILQNAYTDDPTHAERFRHDNEFWLSRLFQSHTGKRLRKMIPGGVTHSIINATREIGTESSSNIPPDPVHVRVEIANYRPRVILACGVNAQKAMDELRIEYIPAPHPAWRQLSDVMIEKYKERIIEELNGYKTTSR